MGESVQLAWLALLGLAGHLGCLTSTSRSVPPPQHAAVHAVLNAPPSSPTPSPHVDAASALSAASRLPDHASLAEATADLESAEADEAPPLEEPYPHEPGDDDDSDSSDANAARSREALLPPSADDEPEPVYWAEALEPIIVRNVRTQVESSIRLYRANGTVDATALETFARTVARDRPVPVHARVVQLVMKAAYHFHAKDVWVLSAYRPRKWGKPQGRHTAGDAVDFQLPGVDYRKVAAYLRACPRAGVGMYTHPHTHFVHVDSRERSFHWVDGSPPGKTWREVPLADPRRTTRDWFFMKADDLPFEPPGSP